ncbi:MAG: hypothetical protein DDT41_01735 [candidate division WS2 bacterium]|nr:hypothetical protein [Candidatus Psychracetigena formicireducens]
MNNWHIITGAPCTRKTTFVNQLEEKGYLVAHETARIYIDREIAKGRIIEEIHKDDFSFQKEILKMKIDLEKSLPKNELIFLDRGIPDSEVYFRLNGKEDDSFLYQAIGGCSYKKCVKSFNYQTETAFEEVVENLTETSFLTSTF